MPVVAVVPVVGVVAVVRVVAVVGVVGVGVAPPDVYEAYSVDLIAAILFVTSGEVGGRLVNDCGRTFFK